MKTPFTYNLPLTFSRRLDRLERQQQRWNLILCAVIVLGSAGIIWLFWGWL